MAATGVRWLRGLTLVRWGRWVALAGWLAVLVIAIATPSACTPDDPSICGPGPGDGLVSGLVMATPLLLWLALRTGYATAIAAGTLGVVYARAPGEAVTLGVYALLCAVLLTHLVIVRRHQRSALPTRPTRVDRPPVRWLRPAALAAAFGCAAIGCLVGYGLDTAHIADHVERATRIEAVVQATDADASTVSLRIAGVPTQTVTVQEVSNYHPGQSVPVLLDGSSNPPWVELVAEPEDVTWWQALAVVAALLAGLTLARPIRDSVRTNDCPPDAVLLIAHPNGRGTVAVLTSPGDGAMLARLRLAIPRAVGTRERPGGASWVDGLPVPRPVLVAGQVCMGGRVTVATVDGTTIGRATLRLPPGRGLSLLPRPARRSPQQPVPPGDRVSPPVGVRPAGMPATGPLPAPATWPPAAPATWPPAAPPTWPPATPPTWPPATPLIGPPTIPMTVRPPRTTRWGGIAMVACGAGLLLAIPLAVSVGPFGPALPIIAVSGWLLWLRGITLLRARLVVDHYGIRLGLAVRDYRVCWRSLSRVSASARGLRLTWHPGVTVDAYPFVSSAGVAALLESLRQRPDATGGTEPPSTRWRPGAILVALYPVAAVLLFWWALSVSA